MTGFRAKKIPPSPLPPHTLQNWIRMDAEEAKISKNRADQKQYLRKKMIQFKLSKVSFRNSGFGKSIRISYFHDFSTILEPHHRPSWQLSGLCERQSFKAIDEVIHIEDRHLSSSVRPAPVLFAPSLKSHCNHEPASGICNESLMCEREFLGYLE